MSNTMRLELDYQYYARNNFSSADYFDNLVKNIDETYKHTVSEETIIYMPIQYDDFVEAKEKGLSTINLDTPSGIAYPHYVIKQITVTFLDIPEDPRDFTDILEHLLSLYGEKASRYCLYKVGYLNGPQ